MNTRLQLMDILTVRQMDGWIMDQWTHVKWTKNEWVALSEYIDTKWIKDTRYIYSLGGLM